MKKGIAAIVPNIDILFRRSAEPIDETKLAKKELSPCIDKKMHDSAKDTVFLSFFLMKRKAESIKLIIPPISNGRLSAFIHEILYLWYIKLASSG